MKKTLLIALLLIVGCGKKDGVNKTYWDDGSLESVKTYKDGQLNGLAIYYYWSHEDDYHIKNYQHKGHFKDGKEDGLWTHWWENGQKQGETTFKDGTPDGLDTYWHENGQKSFEGTYKDGKQDGLWTHWWENGQKKEEGTYKDGELISEQCWDEDRNETECN